MAATTHIIEATQASVNTLLLHSEIKTAVLAADASGQVQSVSVEGTTVTAVVYADLDAGDITAIEDVITDHDSGALFENPVEAARISLAGWDYDTLIDDIEAAADLAALKTECATVATLLKNWAIYAGLISGS